MAIDAHSTTAPAVHPGLLRTDGAPCRVLGKLITEISLPPSILGAVPVPTPDLTAETVAMLDEVFTEIGENPDVAVAAEVFSDPGNNPEGARHGGAICSAADLPCGAAGDAAQEAAHISRRKDLYEILHPETAHGAPSVSRQIGDTRQRSLNDRFTADIAERTGKAERSVRRDERGLPKIPQTFPSEFVVRHGGAGEVCATVAQTAVAMLDGLTPAPLPSLPDAFTRRRALFGAVVLAAAPVVALAPLPAAAATLSPADARLLALADAYEALERRCHEHTAAHRHLRGRASKIVEAEFDAIVERFLPIEEEVTATPADSLAGVLAKARMCQVPTSRQCAQFDHVLSVADDLHRLFGGRHG